jgi:hypothetical protein
MTKHKIKNKHQIPSTKFQINHKFKLPNNRNILASGIGILVIGVYPVIDIIIFHLVSNGVYLACLPVRQGFACLPARQGN